MDLLQCKENKRKLKINVYYKDFDVSTLTNRITYCPNCLRVGYPKDFINFHHTGKVDDTYAIGRCHICKLPVKLRLGREIVKIELEKHIETKALFFCDIESDITNFILKPYKKGFKRWYLPNTSYRDFFGYSSKYKIGRYKDFIKLENYLIREVYTDVEKLYNTTKLPLIYFDEISGYTLNFKSLT